MKSLLVKGSLIVVLSAFSASSASAGDLENILGAVLSNMAQSSTGGGSGMSAPDALSSAIQDLLSEYSELDRFISRRPGRISADPEMVAAVRASEAVNISIQVSNAILYMLNIRNSAGDTPETNGLIARYCRYALTQYDDSTEKLKIAFGITGDHGLRKFMSGSAGNIGRARQAASEILNSVGG
jgi:hypothetical protein